MLTYCSKDDKDQDAGEFLCLYLDALHEELVEPKTYISAYKPASTPSATNLEGEAQSAKGQTEVGKRNYTVRQFFFSLHWA